MSCVHDFDQKECFNIFLLTLYFFDKELYEVGTLRKSFFKFFNNFLKHFLIIYISIL